MALAEREGFEPSIEFPLYTLSKRAPSTTRPSLRFGVASCCFSRISCISTFALPNPVRPASRSVGVVSLTIALLLAAGPAPASDSDSILDVKLNASSAGASCTLRGIVTMLAGASEFYLQDDTSGVHVYSPSYIFREGERLEIEGWMYLSDAGEFQVRARRVWHLADGEMPPPRLIRPREALDGTYQGQLVSVRGTVLAVDFGPQYDTVSVQS